MEQLTIISWEEFVKPDFLLLHLSDGRTLQFTRSNAKGGKKVYHAICTLLDNMDTNPNAAAMLLRLINTIA